MISRVKILVMLTSFIISCGQPTNQKSNLAKSAGDTLLHSYDSLFGELQDKIFIKNLTPVFGYRFEVKGDFNGDGKQEILAEHFFDGFTNKETPKFYEDISYDQLVGITSMYKDPISFVTCSNTKIDTLHISKHGQLLGLSMLRNEGDLNGDGTDEISYVINGADWSNVNSCILATYQKGKWTRLYSFEIRDFQIPDLPQTWNQYGIAGLDDKVIITQEDSVNLVLEKQLEEFPGFIKKIRNNVIQVYTINNEAMEDTVIVDLRKVM